MFGVLRGTSCGLGEAGKREWMGQICGVCLALGREHGQAARLATGYDAALLAALVEAQQPIVPARTSHLCPLRPGLRGDVADPASPGARYGAAAALMIAATRIADDVADGERYGRLPGVAALGRAAGRRAAATLRDLGIDPAPLAEVDRAQAAVEAGDADLLACAAPTAAACAAAFAQTARLAGASANAGPLQLAGAAYGRIIYLIDAVRDRADDAARGRFNPLLAAAAPSPAPLFRSWHAELLGALGAATLVRPALVLGLLDGGLSRAWRSAADAGGAGNAAGPRQKRWRDRCGDCCDGCGSSGHGFCDACDCCCSCARCGGKGGKCCDANCCDGDCGCCGCDCNC